MDGNEPPRRQKVPICRRREGDERTVYSTEKRKKHTLKIRNTEGLSAYSDQVGQIEINYIWFKKLLLQPWSILESTLEDISN